MDTRKYFNVKFLTFFTVQLLPTPSFLQLAYYPVPLPATGEYGLGTRRKLQVDQSNPPSWGLDAIDQKGLPLNNDYTYYGLGKHANS